MERFLYQVFGKTVDSELKHFGQNGFKKLRLTANASFFLLALTFSIGSVAGPKASAQGTSEYHPDAPNKSKLGEWHAQWKGALGGTTYAEGRDEGAAVFMRFNAKFESALMPWLTAVAEPGADVYSSRLQERFDNGDYTSKIRLTNLYLAARPNRYLEARAGALSQDTLKDGLLISGRRSFPGFQERARVDLGHQTRLELIAQQLVPTSYTLNTEREGKEALPTFQTQTLELSGEPAFGRYSAMIGHYTYADLPDKVAYESALRGNTTNNSEAAPGSRFAYQFDGVYGGGQLCLCNFGPVGVEMGYLIEQNLRAPASYGRAQLAEIGPRWRNGDRVLHLKYFNRFVESDAAVASYLPGSLDGTNRVGDGIEVRYVLEDRHWTLKGDWVNSRTIVEHKDQFTFSSFWLSVETEYASF